VSVLGKLKMTIERKKERKEKMTSNLTLSAISNTGGGFALGDIWMGCICLIPIRSIKYKLIIKLIA
jgi:hypothetical protein